CFELMEAEAGYVFECAFQVFRHARKHVPDKTGVADFDLSRLSGEQSRCRAESDGESSGEISSIDHGFHPDTVFYRLVDSFALGVVSASRSPSTNWIPAKTI